MNIREALGKLWFEEKTIEPQIELHQTEVTAEPTEEVQPFAKYYEAEQNAGEKKAKKTKTKKAKKK